MFIPKPPIIVQQSLYGALGSGGFSMTQTSNDQSQRFIHAALAASDDCIKIIGLDGSLQFMNEGGQRVMEIQDFEAVKGCPWPDFWEGKGNIAAVAAINEAREGRSSRFLGFADTATGNRRFWDVKVSPIFDDSGSVDSILSISRDITGVKEFEEQQLLLRNELSHRIKNILALVQSVAGQTLKDDDEMSVAKPAFLARLAALGRAHDLLLRPSHDMTTLKAVAETVANEQSADRIRIDGPKVTLAPKSGLAIALAFHELTTNAIKYGALANESGNISISWEIEKVNEKDCLNLVWRERDGPAVIDPAKKGFGSRMIERALASYVHGTVDLAFERDGLVFSLFAPVEALTQD
ncbi:HWE histidine kinase domain-containing protein [Agrobacterium tumefaciens]|jgi:two-component sensor histidine kinase|nr:HWE histidine kinase domain-containing protein [Rhizobium sp. X9]WKL20663.1 HWE histidine kinase domain-containing protein [Agrobacterium tumefaciens]HBT69109.1 histidine kinase [Agrobacterium sp.]